MAAPESVPLDTAVIREAARWLVRLHSGEAGPEDHAAFERWRHTSPERELAWQRAQLLSKQFGAVPPALGVPLLTRQQKTNRRAVIRTLASLGVALPAAWLGYRHLAGPGGEDYRTAVGESRDMVLADGSHVHLNTDTGLDVLYSEHSRLLHLRGGEIYVRTAADRQGRARPFFIETPQGRMRALGTRFVVRQWNDGEAMTSLSVQEHRVEVSLHGGGAARIVNAGESLSFTASAFKASLPASRNAPGWTRGIIEANNLRLDAFLDELSRYRPGVIRCDPAVAGLRVSGVFRLDDTDAVLAIVAETLGVRVTSRTRYWVTVGARAS
ncbi:iron dicitrate transport regulator FecR [Achromobacter sp. RTa]|uniref:FecR domain-containing protein n=1 Tax=Achromobacter sp. RTa TaxID=1532557 RepID=UPI00050E3F92|nr:FecR domain-containing protein [Achromobacter sp. RTa]KGD86859.1 iron dicitrate transport regulator FecR [Achromobacter sp. RTa]